ncbi:MAG: glycosyltransferase, partial [Acidimicrobiales bacterium]
VLEATVDRVVDVWDAEDLEVSIDAGLFAHLYLHPLPATLGAAPSREHVKLLRPLNFDGRTSDMVQTWMSALGSQRPAVYVTYGTEVAPTAPWRAILGALGGLDVDAVVTTGPNLHPDSLGSTPPNVRVEQFVPQSFLFDRVTVMCSHAGAGSSFGAAARGIPQLCVPLGADQWDNADALSAAGVAITLEDDQRDMDTIRSAFERLLTEPSFKMNAADLADQFQRLPHPDEHVPAIAALTVA